MRSERGQAVVLAVMMMTSFLGMAALVLDTGSWFRERRHLQATADAAALAGAQSLPQDPGSASSLALQYAGSIDDYVRIMLDGNNGGYANDWLLGDNKTGEIALFELGLKNHSVRRTKDGCFFGANYPNSPRLSREETRFDASKKTSSPKLQVPSVSVAISGRRSRASIRSSTFMPTAPPVENCRTIGQRARIASE